MDDFSDYDELDKKVEDNGDVLSVTMLALRNVHGVRRLGDVVRVNISNKLRGKGLSHYPSKLKKSQGEYVLIFRTGSEVHKLVLAVIEPSPDTDNKIRDAVESREQGTLDRIRELLEM